MNTGMKAPEGMGIVVETADIQNYGAKKDQGRTETNSGGHFVL